MQSKVESRKSKASLIFDITQVFLPAPGGEQYVGDGGVGGPAKDGIGLLGICPDLLDVALATAYDGIRELLARDLLEGADDLQHAQAASGTEVEELDLLRSLTAQHTLDSLDVRLSEINHIDIVADAGAIGGVIIIAKDAQLLAQTCSGLGNKGRRLLGTPLGSSPMSAEGWAPIGLK